MDIQDLIVFKTVAKQGSISRAAQELGYVQSTVTSKIQRLESHFKTPLFYRHRHGVTLTLSGKQLVNYAERILNLVHEAEKVVTDSDVPRGSITIGSMETTAAVRLPDALSVFHSRYPEVDLLLATGPTEELVRKVLHYELDGAFVAGPIRHPDLAQQAIIEEELVLISPRSTDTVSTDEDRYAYSSLEKNTLLVFKQGCSYRKKLEQWLHAENIMPHKIMEFGSLEAIIGCVHAGLGVSLLPKSVIQRITAPKTLVCHAIPIEYGKVTTCFVYRKEMVLTKAVEKLIDTVKMVLENDSASTLKQ
ncbi:DNA-binding transcriptional LysR family regulator [Caldalkalibacillus uzonensis]|uniref:DNA-binding transcriptional LysR family regulator n=1 Tax=Caldalkalibacillus uzonensis TaxID=353224 RepID=A0ABU0CNM9_9BACI|nr:LysR family transcriptional regulator [Caldalkalibacillus uzonensis]MDQ0338017.1 DNA-binding transcriptional LysR family regulator [Caldalkalibacillus uzonensis]